MAWKLIDEKSGDEVQIGAELVSGRGRKAVLRSWQPPRHSGSTGRVYTHTKGQSWEDELYPSVFGLKIVEVE